MLQIENEELMTFSFKILELSLIGAEFKVIKADKVYFSVPEKVDTDNEHFTSDEAIKLVKTEMVNTLKNIAKTEENESLRKAIGQSEDEYYDDITDLVKFFAKVRPGVIWTQEDQNKLYKEVYDKIELAKQYNEYKPC